MPNQPPDEEPEGFVASAFLGGLQRAERLSQKAATLPWELLENFGVSPEKTRGPKAFNLKLVDGVYRLTNRMARRALALATAPSRWFSKDHTQAGAAATKKPAGPASAPGQPEDRRR